MLASKAARFAGRQLAREFALFRPKNEYGPAYYEKTQHYKDTKNARKRNSQLYTEKQDQLDLDAVRRQILLGKFEEREYQQMVHRALTLRTACVKLAMQDAINLKQYRKKQEARTNRMKNTILQKELDRANRQRILEVLKMDSANWYTKENLEHKLLNETLIPDVVVSHSDYYSNLQNVAPAHLARHPQRAGRPRQNRRRSLPDQSDQDKELEAGADIQQDQRPHQAPQEVRRERPHR